MRKEIAALFGADGPFVTVYLGAPSDQPQAQQQLLTRWKTVRSALEAEGATDDDLDALDEAVQEATHVGGDTLALVAAGGRLLYRRHLPEPPRYDTSRLALLPWVGPLLEIGQSLLPHLVVLADRSGADLYGFDASGAPFEEEAQAVNQGPVLTRSRPGGWSQRHHQQKAVEAWEENAREVADAVTAAAKQLDARLIALGGDVHAVRLLREALPSELGPLVRELASGSRHPDGGIDQEAESARRLVDTVVAEETVAILEEFKEETGQRDRAVDGPDPTVEMLQTTAVQTLLVHDDPDDDRTAWFGPEPHHLGLDRDTVVAMGVEHPQAARLVDVCIRAALGTSADVRIVPSTVVTGALGAILRHAGTVRRDEGR